MGNRNTTGERTPSTGDPHRGEDPAEDPPPEGGAHRGPTQNTHRHDLFLLYRRGVAGRLATWPCHLRSLLHEQGGSSCGRLWCCSCHVFVCDLFFSFSSHVIQLTPQQQSAEPRNRAGTEALAVARRLKEASREKTRPPPVSRGSSFFFHRRDVARRRATWRCPRMQSDVLVVCLCV